MRIFALLSVWVFVWAGATEGAQKLGPEPGRRGLTQTLHTYLDASGKQSLAEVLAADAMRPIAEVGANHGLSAGALWIRVELQRSADAPADWVLDYRVPSIDHIEVLHEGDSGWQVLMAGNAVPVTLWPRVARTFEFPVHLRADRTEVIYLRARSSGPLMVELDVRPATSELSDVPGWLLPLLPLLAAATLAGFWLLVGNLRIYAPILLFTLCFSLFYAIASGLTHYLGIQHLPWLMPWVATGAMTCAGAVILRMLGDAQSPGMRRALWVGVVAAIVPLSAAFFSPRLANYLNTYLLLVLSVVWFEATRRARARGARHLGLLQVAMAGCVIGAFAYAGMILGVIQFGLTGWSVGVASVGLAVALVGMMPALTLVVERDLRARLLNYTSDALFVSGDGGTALLNQAAQELTGDALEAAGADMSAALTALFPEEDVVAFFEQIERAGRAEREWKLGADARYFEIVGERLLKPRAQMVRLRDITSRRELLLQVAEVERAEALKHFSAFLAHDFRNLSSALLLNAELLDDEQALDAKGRLTVQNIIHTAERAADRSQELMQLCKPSGSGLQTVDLVEAIDRAVSMMAARSEVLKVSWQPPSERAGVLSLPAELEQALLNILTNAQRAMQGRGEITIEMLVTRGSQPGSKLFAQVIIDDTGPGVPVKLRRRIFDPFYTTGGDRGGTGIGLAQARQLAMASGGTIRCAASPSGGARFILSLPVLSLYEQPVVANGATG